MDEPDHVENRPSEAQVHCIPDVRSLGVVAVAEGDGENESQIDIFPEYERALYRIEECPWLWVLFWMHEITEDQRMLMQLAPKRHPEVGIHGAFALRTPARPNPIGLTQVELVRREGLSLWVHGLDARNGSIIIDLKPVKEEEATRRPT